MNWNFISHIYITDITFGRVFDHFLTIDALFHQLYLIFGAKSRRFGAHLQRANTLSSMYYLYFGADFPFGLRSLNDVERDFS